MAIDITLRFLAANADWQGARELGLNSKFQSVLSGNCNSSRHSDFSEFSLLLSERMNFYSYDPESDKITRVKGEVNKAKSVMMENIDKVGEYLCCFSRMVGEKRLAFFARRLFCATVSETFWQI